MSFLQEYGYQVLFLLVLAERAGLPLPAIPILVGAGALIQAGSMSLSPVMGIAVGACLVADLIWFRIGRARGGDVLRWLCRISLEPDSCVRRTEGTFDRFGARSLLVAKFLPPLSVVAVPMSGMLRMPFARFLIFDTLGAILWVGGYVLLGYVFHDQIEWLVDRLAWMGTGLLAIALGVLAGYVLWKWIRRQRFLRQLRVERLRPEELRARLESGPEITLVDLRHGLERDADPVTIPGAIHIPVEELEERWPELPRDREVALFCT